MADMTPTALQQAKPKRNPTLLNRIARKMIGPDPGLGPQPAGQQTTATGVSHPAADSSNNFFVLKTDPARQAIYKDADEMDDSSEEVSTALDVIADNITTSEDGEQLAFDVDSEDQSVQDILDEVVTTSQVKNRIKSIARNLVKYGDVFVEPSINGAAKITDVRSLPPATMHRHEDAQGRLLMTPPKYDSNGKILNKPEECAFEQHSEDDREITAVFYWWQILHGRLNADGFGKYGRTPLRTTRLVWRQLKSLTEALIIGRLTRDILKLVFYVDTTGQSPEDRKLILQEFKDTVTNRTTLDTKRENPYSVFTDFFLSSGYMRIGGQAVPMQTKLDVIDPKNEGIHDITDMLFLHDKLMMTLRVPKEHLWKSDGGSVGALTAKDVQYVRWLRSVQRDISVQILEPLFDLALILNGKDPKNVEYTITWPALRAVDEAAAAQAELAFAQADQLYVQEGVYSPEWVQKNRFGMDPDEIEDIKQELEELQQKKLDQATQMAQTMQPAGQPGQPAPGQSNGAPRDRDGQRKGDEGRDKNGQRIAPTKNKANLPNPTGSRHNTVKASLGDTYRKTKGHVDPQMRLLAEVLREFFTLN